MASKDTKPVASTVKPAPVPTPSQGKSAPKTVASFTFDEPVLTNRPKNVYLENVKGTKILWYTNETGNEIGRTSIKKHNALEQSDTVIGFDYHILATSAELLKITEQSYANTQYHLKDGSRREVVSLEQFRENL